MSEEEKNKNNPLHGVTLQHILETLVERYGFKELGNKIDIRCFFDKSDYKFMFEISKKNTMGKGKSGRVLYQRV